MGREHIAAVIIVAIAFNGCSFSGLGNPFVGTWSGEDSGQTVTYTFRSDHSYTEIVGGALSISGTYTYDTSSKTITLTFSTGIGVVYGYSISGSQLTLTQSGSSFSLDKQ